MQFCLVDLSTYCIWPNATFSFILHAFFLYLLLPTARSAPILRDPEDTSTVSTRLAEYNFDNTTILKQQSREAFLSLQSESVIEPPLLNPQQKRMKWMERKNKGKKRRKDKKGKKIASSPKEALKMAQYEVNLGSVDNIKHQQVCKAQPFKQRIRMEGCITKTIVNKFCHGTCSSYFIPRMRPRKLKLQPIFQSCSACTPSDYDIVDVKLECPDLDTKHIVRQVYKIKKCACKSVDIDLDLPVEGENAEEIDLK